MTTRTVEMLLLLLLLLVHHCPSFFAMGTNDDNQQLMTTSSVDNTMVVVEDHQAILQLNDHDHDQDHDHRQLYDGNPWWLAMYDIATEFSDGTAPEIQIYYEVDKNRPLTDAQITLFAKDCTNVATAISWPKTDLVKPHPTLASVMNVFVMNLKVDTTKLYTSNIWTATPNTGNTEGKIELCVQMELFHRGMKESVSIVKTRFIQNIKLESNYALSPIGAAQIITSEATTTAKVTYSISACVCTGGQVAGGVDVCKPPASFSANTVLRVCIWSNSKEVEIAKVFNLKLEQQDIGNVKYTYEPISFGTPNDLSTVSTKIDTTSGKWSVVTTNILTRFFNKASPQPITVYGVVLLNFRSARRHLDQVNAVHVLRRRGLVEDTLSSLESESPPPSDLGTTTAMFNLNSDANNDDNLKQAALQSGEGDSVETFDFVIPVSSDAVSSIMMVSIIKTIALGIMTMSMTLWITT